ncbi:MAG: hypothetical protein WKF89_03800 [Chitinophagaceae bacterium]
MVAAFVSVGTSLWGRHPKPYIRGSLFFLIHCCCFIALSLAIYAQERGILLNGNFETGDLSQFGGSEGLDEELKIVNKRDAMMPNRSSLAGIKKVIK